MKTGSKNILILTSGTGGGHQAIAKAMEQIIKTNSPQSQISIINIMPRLSSAAYRVIGDYFLKTIHKNYQASNNPQSAKTLHHIYTPLVLPKITRNIKRLKPDLIISTSSFSTSELKTSLSFLNQSIPHIVVLADPFSIHHVWTTYKQADKYLVPTPQTAKILAQRKIPKSKIAITGLPLRTCFFQPQLTHRQAQTKLNLQPNRLIFLIGGSGEGLGRLYLLTKTLIRHPTVNQNCQLLIIAARNKLLYKKLKTLQKKYPLALNTYGFVNNIDELIIASHTVIGKPGPNILFETLMLNKPFITNSPPLSQELGNYQYIKSNHLGLVAYRPQQVLKHILKLINQPNHLKQFLPGIKKHQQQYQNTPEKIWQTLKPFL